MIVKNESSILTRLFDSVVSLIDCYCICDTGSTDGTQEMIRDYFDKKGIPGIVFEEPFIDFATSRNIALQKCVGMSDYVLLLDADFMLEYNLESKLEVNSILDLNKDAYFILQGSNEFYFKNIRMVKNNGTFFYKGVTHEYLSLPPGSTTSIIEKDLLFIKDIGDGGSKSDKFERDIRLLTEGLKQEPNNERYHFYLVNSYFDSKIWEKAIEWYKKRISLGGWSQEIWYSYYRIGLVHKEVGQIDAAIAAWMEAYAIVPLRIENLYEIVKWYRTNEKYVLANTYYKMAKGSLDQLTLEIKNDFLFVNNEVYTYLLDYEYSIFGFYLGYKDIEPRIINILNHSRNWNIIQNTMSNIQFYKDVLQWIPEKTINLSQTIEYDICGKLRTFWSSSPCLILCTPSLRAALNINDEKVSYVANVRYVNYTVDDCGVYTHNERLITVNQCLLFDASLSILREKWIECEDTEDKYYVGVEDIRIFERNGTVWFIGTGFFENEHLGLKYGLYTLDRPLVPRELTCSFQKHCEKNWVFVLPLLPLLRKVEQNVEPNVEQNVEPNVEQNVEPNVEPNQESYNTIIYHWYPLQICHIIVDNKEKNDTIKLVSTMEMPLLFKNVRGSTCGFAYNQEIWFVVHLVSYEGTNEYPSKRSYYHMIVVFDETMTRLKRYSAPFTLEKNCIEFCLGIIVEENRVILSYSTLDQTSRIAVYDKAYVEERLCF
jgi:tetratricopeptide (TPR) repeat protein